MQEDSHVLESNHDNDYTHPALSAGRTLARTDTTRFPITSPD